MKKRKKVFLPAWQKKFVPVLLLLIWLFTTYQKFFTDQSMSTAEYILMTAVFLFAGGFVYAMASGKLPAYEIEEEIE